MPLGLTWPQLLGLSVVAAIVSVLGSLVATWLKDYLFARSLERWKSRQAIVAIYARYRAPILLAAREVKGRIDDICTSYPTNHLKTSVLLAEPAKQFKINDVKDPYYQQYLLLSTHYRLCVFLGWLELYRQEVTFLDTGGREVSARLEDALEQIRGDLADGHLNRAENLWKWNDQLIFREEQRAIGENMATDRLPPSVIGYGAFRVLFYQALRNNTGELWWIKVVTRFLVDLDSVNDFRRTRFERLAQHLQQVIDLLEIDPHQRKLGRVRSHERRLFTVAMTGRGGRGAFNLSSTTFSDLFP